MGYLKIPCISINLPIYHGTSGTVLEHGIGHLAASSFPIGGKDTHAVLTGHTGLSSDKNLYRSDRDRKREYFLFYTCYWNKKLAYRVDQITVVEPQDTKELQIMEGKDLVTLVTCTPYGVNDKRLLVRGVRTAYHAKEEEIRARNHHSQWMEVYKRAIFAGLLIICVLIAARKVYEKMKEKAGKGDMGETKDHKYCWNLFSGNRDHVTALSGDHIISETKTVRSDGERTDAEEKQKKTG